MIVDCHTHVTFSSSVGWEPLIDRMLHHMEMVGIDRTCLMPMPNFGGSWYPNEKQMNEQAETLARIAERHPGRFYPMMLINPTLSFGFLKRLADTYVLNGPIIGTKYHVAMLADDPRADEFYSYLEENDIPVLFHAWYKTVSKEPFESDPTHISGMAAKHPRLRILMAHLTGCKLRGLHDVKRHPNVLIDTSGSQPEDGYLAEALEVLGPQRVLYGSDYPIRAFGTQLARIDSVPMQCEVRELVLHRNAVHFFRKGREGVQ